MEQFEAYFRRADLDQDGRISGAEAVAFLQGSNLSKQVLAQIWAHADKSHTGFLSRDEFYNALKLVTVAQSKRELTPDIVKAALYGPASVKIPAPQINLSAIPAPQLNSAGAAPVPRSNLASAAPASQMGAVAPMVSQGFRGQAPPGTSVNPQYFPSQSNQSTRPPLPLPGGAGSAVRPPQGVTTSLPRGGTMVGPGLQSANMSSEWLTGRTSGTSFGATMQAPTRGTSFPMPLVASNPQDSLSTTSLTTSKDPNALIGSGSRPALESAFGNDSSSAKQTSSVPSYLASGTPPSTSVPVSTAPQSTAKPDPFEALQSTFTRQPSGSQPQQTQSLPKPNQQVSAQATASLPASGTPTAVGPPGSEQSQIPWPKMTRAGVQKYTKVFMEVDTDRDGRITGEQARNLFLSWRLPREVLKQVWDLSDQDSDSMLTLREFCTALYLMERYREGRPLPSSLPPSIMLDEMLLSMAGPPTAAYGAVGWGPTPGLRPQQGIPGSQQTLTPSGIRPPMQTMHLQADGSMQFDQKSARGFESSLANQLSNGELSSMDVTGQDAVETEKKAESNDKVYMDSKEKLEFYRSKMQDLVLYRSRCDNRLNEITERASADKREAEMLGKKYEEKYKQVAEIASKLTIEEASFREIQERKMELQQAITKMEQGGSADGILQVRADRIQSDLEELLKALAERCKKHGIELKSTALVELPPGWQPGIPEVAAVWDEDWDKFEDEGFSFDVAMPANAKSSSPQKGSSPAHSYSSDSVSNADAKSENTYNKGGSAFEAESAYFHSEDESKSSQASPRRQEIFESPSQEYSDNHFGNSFEPDAETHRSFDEPSWGTFDNNDDIDSVWGFNVKDPDREKHGETYFFDSNNSGASPRRTDSPRTDTVFQKSSPFIFEDSTPGSPLSRAGNSPTRYSASGDPFFDSFSRYDSFRTNDRASSPRQETFTRFDSMSSTQGFDHSRGFSFDDSDPFGSSGPFKVSSEGQSSKKDSEHWNSF